MQMIGSIFLGGGGSAEQSKPLDDALVAQFDGPAQPTCLYIPVAMDEAKHASAHEWFVGNYGGRFSTVDIAGRLSEFDMDRKFDVIYIGGGNTGRLLDSIYDSGFDDYLTKHIEEGGVVYGGSAGAIVLGRTILTTPDIEHSVRSNEGLDLLDGWAIVAHYDDNNADRERVAEMSAQLGSALLAISEDAGVIVDRRGAMESVGHSSVFVFEPGQNPHPLMSV